MVRIATVNDAEQLETLNNEFNGKGETTLANIRESLLNNAQEIVVVNDNGDELTGFVCVQMKKSFCYDEYMPEITEVYVKPQYRKQGLPKRWWHLPKNIAESIIRFIKWNCLQESTTP